MEKLNVNPDQAINFSVISGKWGNETGTNVVMSAKTTLANTNPDLQYTVTGTASSALSMDITPQVWKKTDAGDVLVFTGAPATCSAAVVILRSRPGADPNPGPLRGRI